MLVSKKNRRFFHKKERRGYILLITILVISAVGVSSVVSVILLGVGFSKTSLVFKQSHFARGLADSCLEVALGRIRDNNNFSGTGNVTMTFGTCTYSVPAGAVPKTVTASGTAGTVVRKVSATITVFKPAMLLSAWQEVAD